MRNLIMTLLICSLFVSCNILSSSKSGEIEIKLVPQTALINDPVNLVIRNDTNRSIRYHCGHVVERKQNEEWIEHTVTGCAGFPVEIKSGRNYVIDDFLLAPSQPGFYRAIVDISSDGEEFTGTGKTSEPVEFIDENSE